MNTKFLSNKTFVQKLEHCIEYAKIDSEKIINKQRVWEFIKCGIRTECIQYSLNMSKESKKNEKDLVYRIKILEEKIDSSPNVELLEEYSTLKRDLDFIYNERARGVIMRSRCQWIDENEKCSKFFLRKEKLNYSTKHIKTLLINGQIVSDPKLILDCGKTFYKNLYTERSDNTNFNIDCYMQNIQGPKIDNETKAMCEKDITEEECENAIKDLPSNKTPGPDGIPIDLYKKIWKEIKVPLMNSFKLSKQQNILPEDQRGGVINMIPKDGKDIRELKNWRPITLLNADYKILTKIFANRMKVALKEIINPDQIGYMKNRFCGENTRLIADIIEYSIIYKKTGILLLIDFEKAFDTISWKFLYKVLKKFNFGPSFIEWINIFYKRIFSCVLNNGYASENFNITRGIRQGDPISALLFLPVAEILALLIRNNVNIKGYVIQDMELKLCQLADDTTLFIQDNNSLREVLKIFEEFYRYAGLKLNKTKTVAIIVWNDGSIYKDPSIGILWSDKPFKTLGIWYSLDICEMQEINISNKLKKMHLLLNMWSARSLSIKGKITVIKTIIMPHILHIASVLYLEERVIKQIEKMFYKFLWSNRKHGVSKDTLIQPIELGGLKMICISSMLKSAKLMWVKRLLDNINSKWKKVSWFLMGITHEQLFSKTNRKYLNRENIISFYGQTLDVWYNFISKEPQNWEEVANENFFNNTFILIDNKSVQTDFKMLRKAKVVDFL